jgi:hypothetical protein
VKKLGIPVRLIDDNESARIFGAPISQFGKDEVDRATSKKLLSLVEEPKP